MKRRLSIIIDAGEKECGNCSWLVKSIPMVRTASCKLFNDHIQYVKPIERDLKYARLTKCLSAERST